MTYRVLVVEDNEELAENVAELLEELDVQAVCVSTVDEALAAADQGFDLAIVDVSLPGGSGIGLVPALKARAHDAEVVLMTGHGTIESAIAAVRHGALAYLLKPFDPVALVQLVERALAQVSLRRERAALARALHESEALYRSVVETAEALIVGIDRDGGVVFANRAAIEVCDKLPTGRGFVTVWGKEDSKLEEIVMLALRGVPVQPREAVIDCAARRTIRWTFTDLVDGAQSRIAVLAVGIDVTEQLELRQRSARSEALAAIGTLTAGLAHEIRNPLNAAVLQLQLLGRAAKRLQPEIAEKMTARVGIVEDELRRLTKMLDDFLGLARPEEAHHELIDVCALLRDVCSMQGPLCARESVSVIVDCSGPTEVRGDRHRLKQVLVNLITNACEALTEGGEVHLGCCISGEWVQIMVSDNGPGFGRDPDKVFEPFHTTKPAGTGLGLTIVKKIIEMHEGTVELGNTPEGGALVTLSLPA